MQVLPAGRCGRRCCQPACTDRTSTPDPPETSLDIQLFFVFLSRRVQDYQTSMNGKQVRILNFFLFSSTRLQNYQTSTNLDSQLFLVFFCRQGYKTIKLAHVWMGKTFVHKCFIPFCAKSIHNFKYLRKTNLFFTSSMVGLRENGVFLYTASKILAFTWLLSISIYLRFLNIYWYIDLCHDIISIYW